MESKSSPDKLKKNKMTEKIVNGFFALTISSSAFDIPPISHPPANTISSTSPPVSETHPLDWRLEPRLVIEYPPKAIPQHISMFCFPIQAGLVYGSNQPKSAYHSFVVTDDAGVKQHGICLVTYKKIDGEIKTSFEIACEKWKRSAFSQSDLEYADHVKEKLEESQKLAAEAKMNGPHGKMEEWEDKCTLYRGLLAPYQKLMISSDSVYVPHAIGLVGFWPFYGFYRDWLVYISKEFDDYSEIPLERYLVHLFHEIPIPPAGEIQLQVPLSPDITVPISRPSLNQSSVPISMPSYPLFTVLSLDNIITTFENIVLESKIIFVSAHFSLLNMAAETFTSYLYPLRWHHTYIPVLPSQLLDFIQAPFPFIIGLHPSMLKEIPEDVLVVDLDHDQLKVINGGVKKALAYRDRKKLLSRLQKYCNVDKSKRTNGGILEDAARGWWSAVDASQNDTPDKHEVFEHLRKWVKQPTESIDTFGKFWKSRKQNDVEASPQHKTEPRKQTNSAMKALPKPPQTISLDTLNESNESTSFKVPEIVMPTLQGSDEKISRSSSITSFRTAQSGVSEIHSEGSIASSDVNSSAEISKATVIRSPHIKIKKHFKPPERVDTPQPLSPISHSPGTLSKSPDLTFYFYSIKCPETEEEPEEFEFIHSTVNHPDFVYKNSVSFNNLALTRATCPFLTNSIANSFDGRVIVDSKTNVQDIKIEGHSFHTSFPLCDVQQSVKEDLIMGWCCVCSEPCKSPVLSDQQYVMTKSGLAMVTDYHPSEERSTLQCVNCRMVIHADCLRSDLKYCRGCFDPVGIRSSFLRFWVSVLSEYKQYNISNGETTGEDLGKNKNPLEVAWSRLKIMSSASLSVEECKKIQNLPTFKTKEFVENSSMEQRPFISGLVSTLAFAEFIYANLDETNSEMLFFDECITWRNNKSMLANPKETPFLKDKQYRISKTETTMAVNKSSLGVEKTIYTMRGPLDQTLLVAPRIHKKYVTEKDAMKIKVHTNTIIRRSKATKKKEKSFLSVVFGVGGDSADGKRGIKDAPSPLVLKSSQMDEGQTKEQEGPHPPPKPELLQRNSSLLLGEDEFSWYTKYEVFG